MDIGSEVITLEKRRWSAAIFVTAFCFLFIAFGGNVSIGAEQYTHTVIKGDTLWDICEEYYGDPDLWPKLWQINPFVTNPHLLNPGDTVTLLEDIPIKRQPPAKNDEKEPTSDDTADIKIGISVSSMTEINAIGFLSTKIIEPTGCIFADEKEKVVLSKGDAIFVDVAKKHIVNPGDQFTIYDSSPPFHNPLTGEKWGYVISFLGRLAIGDKVKENIYKAKIIKNYREIRVGDSFLPYIPRLSCIQPLPTEPDLTTNIVSAKDRYQVIGKYSVVYLGDGFKKGIRRGNMFEIIRQIKAGSKEKPTLLDVALGNMLVIEAGPDRATGIVLIATKDFYHGTLVRGVDWEKVQDLLLKMPECRYK